MDEHYHMHFGHFKTIRTNNLIQENGRHPSNLSVEHCFFVNNCHIVFVIFSFELFIVNNLEIITTINHIRPLLKTLDNWYVVLQSMCSSSSKNWSNVKRQTSPQ